MDRRNVLVDGLVEGGTVENLSRESGYQTPDPRRHDRGNLFRWSLSVTLMVVLHAFWWFWLSPRISERPPPATRGPALRVLAGDSGRRIWSPTVLALPSDIGFSGTVMTNQLGEGPTIRMPRGPARFLERGSYDVASEPAAEVWTQPPLVVRPPPPPTLADAGDRAVVKPASAQLRFFFDEAAIPDAGFDLADVGAGEGQPWAVSAWVEIGPDGDVRHALIEQSSGIGEVDQTVLRALYQWHPGPAFHDRAGSVTLRFAPGPEGAP